MVAIQENEQGQWEPLLVFSLQGICHYLLQTAKRTIRKITKNNLKPIATFNSYHVRSNIGFSCTIGDNCALNQELIFTLHIRWSYTLSLHGNCSQKVMCENSIMEGWCWHKWNTGNIAGNNNHVKCINCIWQHRKEQMHNDELQSFCL